MTAGRVWLPPPALLFFAVIGAILLLVVAVYRWPVPADELSYYIGARRLIDGVPLYDPTATAVTPYAYRYPPPLAQFLVPFALILSPAVFTVLWTALLISGGMAGLAGALEAAGPLGQLTPHVPAGYGFAAIIVAYVGRLHPVGCVFSAVLLSMFHIGGELAQTRLGLPKSLTGVFQGLLLFTLLACDTLIHFRVRRAVVLAPAAAKAA